MKFALVVAAAIMTAACGGKSKSAKDPEASGQCCCVWGEGQEVVGEVTCRDRGGNCDPVDACDQPPTETPGEESDPTDY